MTACGAAVVVVVARYILSCAEQLCCLTTAAAAAAAAAIIAALCCHQAAQNVLVDHWAAKGEAPLRQLNTQVREITRGARWSSSPCWSHPLIYECLGICRSQYDCLGI
jgi:hypothetical protein